MTLTEFLRARIDEDEEGCDHDCETLNEQWYAERMRAECEAKRRIVAAHPRATITFSGEEAWHFCLRYLAIVYADHPDYRDEWKP